MKCNDCKAPNESSIFFIRIVAAPNEVLAIKIGREGDGRWVLARKWTSVDLRPPSLFVASGARSTPATFIDTGRKNKLA
jgi:hypothetical protein